MAVIIDEMEVVVAAPQPANSAGGQAPSPRGPREAPPPSALAPADLADVLRHAAERLARIEAH